MMKKDIMDSFRKLFGKEVPSHTIPNKTYKVYMGKEGLVCGCKDWEMRAGSWVITFKDKDGNLFAIQGCKHMEDFLVGTGVKVYGKQKV